MKKSFLLFASLCLALSVMAMPARRGAIVKQQPDGSTITVFQHGDEHFHYLTNAHGEWLKQDANGFYVVTEALTNEQIKARRMASPMLKTQMRRAQEAAQTAIPLNIADYGLIILVNFKDKSFRAANSLEAMQDMHSGENYTHNGATGSARQYFYDQSMGKYNPQFDVVGPVTVSQNMRYYGGSDSNGNDELAHEMIAEACKLADTQFNIDFTKYDNNNDGYVDFVYVIYAGQGQADSGEANTVWPHAWSLEDAKNYYPRFSGCTVDGRKIDTYACGPEINYEYQREGIGTFCHEFSHVCGLPDLYSTDENTTHKTMGSWDILDYGPYNNDGNTPPAYSAYERFFCGWLTPEYIHTPSDLTLEEIQSSNKAYIITEAAQPNLIGNDPNPTTFYLLENRQQTGWDTYLPGHGMMLTKIQYRYSSWTDNTVNNSSSNMGVDIIEADGQAPRLQYGNDGYPKDNGNNGKPGDLFPTGNTSYTNITNRSITDIKESNGSISFKFMGGEDGSETPEPPVTTSYISVTEAYEMALTLSSGQSSADSVSVYGEVISIDEIETSKYGNATFTISDGTSNLYCYHTYYLNRAKFTSSDQLKVGDKVIVRGLLKNYYDKNKQKSTYEIATGYIKEINPVISSVESIELNHTLIAADGQLYLTEPIGHTMHVLNPLGQTIYNGNATTLSLPHGLYIVRIDNIIYKVEL